MDEAEKISISLEQAVEWMLDKLCEGEPKAVRNMAWTMLATRMGFSGGMGSYFILPPIDEV